MCFLFILNKCLCNITAENSGHIENRYYLNQRNIIWITERAYGKISMINEPGPFVIQLAYAIMGYEKLANCCVKKVKGCKDYEEISGDVLNVIYQMFSQFLIDHGYPDKFRFLELAKINKYLNRACSYSRRKIKDLEDN